jgi:hypothetical protein
MRRNRAHKFSALLTCHVLLLATWMPATLSASEGQRKRSELSYLSTTDRTNTAQRLQRKEETRIQRRAAFIKSRGLLSTEGVPFEPNDLLEPGWRQTLASKINQLPQMQSDRTITSDRLSGVYMADTLYLPEKMRGDSEIVILARRLVYGGMNAEIIAPGHDVSIFVIESVEHAPQKRQLDAVWSIPSVYIRTGAPDPPKQVGTLPSPIPKPAVWTGRTLDRINAALRVSTALSYGYAVARFEADGTVGNPGANGSDGANGGNGDAGANGDPGDCSGTRNGTAGNSAFSGQGGSTGGNGTNGGPGTGAGNITDSIPSSASGTYTYSARGGTGGLGGSGGTGGRGGNGGAGGNGGNGATCTDCVLGPGSGGNGGNGGSGGSRGDGGNGGNGGTGGNGGIITITNNSCNATVDPHVDAGQGGGGGAAGSVGNGGGGGAGGNPGVKGSTNCSGFNPSNGTPGVSGPDGGGGEAGAGGQHGENGQPGSSYVERNCDSSECGCHSDYECDSCLSNAYCQSSECWGYTPILIDVNGV